MAVAILIVTGVVKDRLGPSASAHMLSKPSFGRENGLSAFPLRHSLEDLLVESGMLRFFEETERVFETPLDPVLRLRGIRRVNARNCRNNGGTYPCNSHNTPPLAPLKRCLSEACSGLQRRAVRCR